MPGSSPHTEVILELFSLLIGQLSVVELGQLWPGAGASRGCFTRFLTVGDAGRLIMLLMVFCPLEPHVYDLWSWLQGFI